MSSKVNLVGVLVRCKPEMAEQVQDTLDAMAGVEVHARDDKGQLVVTIDESETPGTAVDTLEMIHKAPGVLLAALTYHEVADADELDAPQQESPLS
jgi:nitrate reductase NapAB chaperone NapD